MLRFRVLLFCSIDGNVLKIKIMAIQPWIKLKSTHHVGKRRVYGLNNRTAVDFLIFPKAA